MELKLSQLVNRLPLNGGESYSKSYSLCSKGLEPRAKYHFTVSTLNIAALDWKKQWAIGQSIYPQ